MELIPINKNTSLLCIGNLEPNSYLNLLDLVENKQKIFCLTKISSSIFQQKNLFQFDNLNESITKFSVIYIDKYEYSYESIQNITKSFLNSGGYLLLEHGYDQKDRIVKLLEESYTSIKTFKDLNKVDRAVLAKLR